MITESHLQFKTKEEVAEIILAMQQIISEKDKIIVEKNTVIADKNKTIEYLYEQFRLSRYKRFGNKSEKDLGGARQLSLFDEAIPPDNTPEIVEADEELTIPEHTRKKKGRKSLPKHLPRKQEVYDLPYVSMPFEIETKPLYRFALFTEADGGFRFILVLHHLLIDGGSFNILISEISNYYNFPTYKLAYTLSQQENMLINSAKLEAEKTCSCGCALTYIGDEVSEQLEIIPMKVYIIEHIRKKYACRGCEETIKQAAMPRHPIPKSIAVPGLLAHTLVSKFEDHLPLYRQEHILQRVGVDIPRATLSHWVIKCAQLLSPLTKLLLAHIHDYDVAYADESTVQVLKEPGRNAETKSYMWVLGGGPPDKFALVYHYAPSRAHTVPLDFYRHTRQIYRL